MDNSREAILRHIIQQEEILCLRFLLRSADTPDMIR